MTSQSITHERFEQIRADHMEICELVATLYRVLAERNAPAARVSHLLESLLQRIAGHFQDEEAYGLFDDLKARCPQDLNAIDSTRFEHGELLDQLTQLVRQANDTELTGELWDKLEHGFRDFGNALSRHESRENELLLDAYENDLGNKD